MSRNADLQAAAKAKKDEFYTQITDIEKELKYYRGHFQGKTVFCNCDDPFESAFFRYFVLNFNKLGLKKLLATCYVGSPIANKQFSLYDVPGASRSARNGGKPYAAEVTVVRDATGDGALDMADIAELFKSGENSLRELRGDGDFRSPESVGLLKEADVVVTNPPFSLFREYVAQLMEFKKKFLVIGNVNAITYKEFFPYIMTNRVWIGPSIHSGDRKFNVPADYPLNAAGCGVDENGQKFIKVKGVRWFTNLDFKKRHEKMILVKKYDPELYPRYDNYDAIEVGKTADIPADYPGVMGVPITFLDKHNPEQFEIVGMAKRGAGDPALKTRVYSKQDYPNYSDLNAGPTLWVNGTLKNTYPRILIRRKS